MSPGRKRRMLSASAPPSSSSFLRQSSEDPVRGGFAAGTTPIVEATHTTTCVGCGRVLQAGDWQQVLNGRAAHAICAVFAQAASIDRTDDAPDVVDTAGTPTDGPDPTPAATGQASPEHTCGGQDGAGGHRSTGQCPAAYPHHTELVNPPTLQSGECRFSVRFPGWTTDVVADSFEDAAWEAHEAVREHYPSQAVEVRCAGPLPPTYAVWLDARPARVPCQHQVGGTRPVPGLRQSPTRQPVRRGAGPGRLPRRQARHPGRRRSRPPRTAGAARPTRTKHDPLYKIHLLDRSAGTRRDLARSRQGAGSARDTEEHSQDRRRRLAMRTP